MLPIHFLLQHYACGYRSTNRFIVFQVLPHTLELGPEVWRVLAKCHDLRNLAEYEGYLEVDVKLLDDLLNATQMVLASVKTFNNKK